MKYDVAVVGGGIVGLAMAWEAAQRGLAVVLLDRTPQAEGASIRNFGMVWPIGQPPGELYQRALQSRRAWVELSQAANIWLKPCGSVHVVYHVEEWQVLQEFAELAPKQGVSCELMSRDQVLARVPAVCPEGLLGGLWSPTECVVDPPLAIRRIAPYLAERYQVQVRPNTVVVGIEMPYLHLGHGERIRAERVFVCSGTDLETLFPTVYASSGVRKCKLQMMRTVSQPGGWRIGPHLAGGLTLGHYKAFELCSTIPAMKRLHTAQYADYGRLGIHVMASQNSAGEVIIGDSHEYDSDITPFDRPEIDELILAYLRKFLQLPEWRLAARWHGIYAKHPQLPLLTTQPQPQCFIVNAPGGAGMTMSFGNASYLWNELDQNRWPENC